MRDFVVVGVKHSEPRISEELVDKIESPVSAVYHETPEEQATYWEFLWKLVARSQFTTIWMSSKGEPKIRTECQKAVSELADQHDLCGFLLLISHTETVSLQ